MTTIQVIKQSGCCVKKHNNKTQHKVHGGQHSPTIHRYLQLNGISVGFQPLKPPHPKHPLWEGLKADLLFLCLHNNKNTIMSSVPQGATP